MKNYQLIILVILFSIVAIILETTVINFPFVFLIGATLVVLIKKIPMLIGVFILSFIIDAMRVTNFGLTALFIFATLAIILLYEKYSGSDDLLVAAFVVAVMLFLYSHFFMYSTTLLMGFFVLAFLLLYIVNFLKKKGKFL